VNPIITLAPNAAQAIKLFLSDKGLQKPLRIDLQSSGCCDPSLGLIVDNINEADLIQEIDGLMFVISPETHRLVGEVMISYADDADKIGFVLTSSKPVSEWDGFGVTTIKV
jgi:Fe-S cluster assembly iron-binding protein IscA